MNKSELRSSLIVTCESLSAAERENAASAAAKIFAESLLFLTELSFSVYLSHKYEINLAPIIKLLWETNKKVFLPTVANAKQKIMQFKSYDSTTRLIENRFNILEPVSDVVVDAASLDVVLVPLVGFDMQGFRIGKGGGFYDATFEFLQTQPRALKPQLIGVAYEAQRVTEIPHDEWDVTLDGVLTEQQLYFFDYND